MGRNTGAVDSNSLTIHKGQYPRTLNNGTMD